MGKNYQKLRNNKEKELEKKKRSLFFLGSFSILFLVLIVGISYALYALTLRGEKEASITAGTLAIEFKDGNTISFENAYPMSDSKGMNTTPYEFSIENKGSIKAVYDVSLETDSNNTLNSETLKYVVKKGEGEWSTPRILNSLSLEKDITIEPGVKETYQLKLWMNENVGNEAQGKVFKARIVVSSTQESTRPKDVASPVINLAGDLSINVEQNKEFVDPGVESVSDNQDSLNKEEVRVSYEYYDGETITEVDSIDTSKLGVYYIYYKISDKSLNEGVVIRSVNIYKKDTTPPTIRLNGESEVIIEKESVYEELGAVAEEDGVDISNRVVTVGEVNTKRPGEYIIKYLITDTFGNTASVIRKVIVEVFNIYQVVYDYSMNGGSSSTKINEEVKRGNEVDLSVSAVKEGWIFVGWNTKKDAHTGLDRLVM